MKQKDMLLHISVGSLLIGIIIWARLNMDLLEPILRDSTLFFQLIVAGTVIAILRNVIGIRTFGVFGPAIIAFGIVKPGPLFGTALYLDVFLVSMLVSLLLHKVHLSSSHRMAIVITVASITITFMELVGEIFHVNILQLSIFFPVLITSWLADRFVLQAMEIDWIEPSKKLFGTIIVVLISFVIVTFSPLITFVALTPAIWGLLIILNVVVGLKVNFRLSEYLRFKQAMSEDGGFLSILGMNRRNSHYISKYNPRGLFPFIRKDRLKKTLHDLTIPAPATYCVVETKKDIDCALATMESVETFVVKPAGGHGGEGILVLWKDKKGDFIAKDRIWSHSMVKDHINQILDGQFSADWSDIAIIEETVIPSGVLAKYTPKGVPDVRVIMFEGFPVMAMSRIPTNESDGSANMHKGAIGLGLRIRDGKAVNPYWKGHGGSITKHPDSGLDLRNIKMENWEEILRISSKAQAATRLGYAGVDLVIDKKGPMVLEVNKRPGLEIQNANLAGLEKRLRFLESRLGEIRFLSPVEKVKFVMDLDSRGWVE